MWSDDTNLLVSWKSDRVIYGNVIGEEGIPIWSFLACHGALYYGEKKAF